jgi:hypothetical protein
MNYIGALVRAVLAAAYWWGVGIVLYIVTGGDPSPQNVAPTFVQTYGPVALVVAGGILVYSLLIFADRRWAR